jgi:hypothetical protein
VTIERIRAMLGERPFRPFSIHTSDGQVVTVRAPDFAWVHPSGRTMYVCPDPDVDADEVIDLLRVTKLATGVRNGGGGRKRRR